MTTRRPLRSIVPSSAGWTPVSTLINVDLPAPLSPTSPSTSPSRTSRSTPRTASTPPKRLTIPRSTTCGWEWGGGVASPTCMRVASSVTTCLKLGLDLGPVLHEFQRFDRHLRDDVLATRDHHHVQWVLLLDRLVIQVGVHGFGDVASAGLTVAEDRAADQAFPDHV